MKISAINPTQNNQQKMQSFKGKFLYDELNLLPKQLKEVETLAKNFDISKKPYDISVFSDPRDSHLFFVAEDRVKNNKYSVSVGLSQQRPNLLDEKVSYLINKYDSEYIKPYTTWGKIKKMLDLINPFSY